MSTTSNGTSRSQVHMWPSSTNANPYVPFGIEVLPMQTAHPWGCAHLCHTRFLQGWQISKKNTAEQWFCTIIWTILWQSNLKVSSHSGKQTKRNGLAVSVWSGEPGTSYEEFGRGHASNRLVEWRAGTRGPLDKIANLLQEGHLPNYPANHTNWEPLRANITGT